MSFESSSLDSCFRGAHVKSKVLFRIRSSVAPSLNVYKYILESKLTPRIPNLLNFEFIGLIFWLIIVESTAVKNRKTTKTEILKHLLCSREGNRGLV